MEEAKKLLEAALLRTKKEAKDYYELIFEQRLQNSSKRAGSFYKFKTAKELEKALLNAKWEIHEGSPSAGKVILKTHSIEGFDGVLPLSKVKDKKDIFTVNPKNISGRDDMAIHVENDQAFPKTKETWLIISYYNPEKKIVEVDKPFMPTFFPGKLIGPDDTVKGKGKYVKLIKKA